MTPDDWNEILSEAPGGDNHGRKRTGGSWLRLDNAAHEYQDLKFEYLIDVESHGTRATYQAGCRCEPCRRANREYVRQRRQNMPQKLTGSDLTRREPEDGLRDGGNA